MAVKKREDREKKFEELLGELEGIVAGLETGAPDLEQSINAFERGMELSRECHRRLEEAEAKIRLVKRRADGTAEEGEFRGGEET